MSEPIVQFLLRVPASVKQKIEDAAKENNRSTNAEALVRLEKSFELLEKEANQNQIRPYLVSIEQRIAELQNSLGQLKTKYQEETKTPE